MLSILNAHKATIAKQSSSRAETISHMYADDATLLYVPTGTGAHGKLAIENFIKVASSQYHIVESEQILSRIVSGQSIVEESVLTLFHSDTIDWLLPGVRATKKTIVVPLVSILSVNENDQITSKRVYWDQASVLRQIGVLPRSLYCKANASEVVLPILDASIANNLRALDLNESVAADLASVHISETASVQSGRPRVAAAGIIPGQTAAYDEDAPIRSSANRPKTDVFNIEPVEEHNPARRPSAPASVASNDSFNETRSQTHTSIKMHGRSTHAIGSNVFNTDEEAQSRGSSASGHGRRTYGDRGSKSQFSFGSSDSIAEEQQPVRSSQNNIFGAPQQQQSQQHTGRKMAPGQGQSQISFGTYDPETDNAPAVGTSQVNTFRGRRDPNARSTELDARPSSRVTKAPGGGSSFSFA
ncbi:hypothetical protein BC831DRAFT_228483 [Entophlyctis helioformis]|nr:hypothetical protein BC831DRAFT_228483 [Entophlyctis helioformis]